MFLKKSDRVTENSNIDGKSTSPSQESDKTMDKPVIGRTRHNIWMFCIFYKERLFEIREILDLKLLKNCYHIVKIIHIYM